MKQTTTRKARAARPRQEDTDTSALAEQTAENANHPERARQAPGSADRAALDAREENNPRASGGVDDAERQRRRENMNLGEESRVRAGAARRDSDDTARKQHAKKTGGNLFPEVQPEDQQVVLATNSKRVGSPQFMAQFRLHSRESPDGSFYSDRNGSYSILEPGVESWATLPGE